MSLGVKLLGKIFVHCHCEDHQRHNEAILYFKNIQINLINLFHDITSCETRPIWEPVYLAYLIIVSYKINCIYIWGIIDRE